MASRVGKEVNAMTKDEFRNYNRGIAYQVELHKNGEITNEKLYQFMKAQLGKEAFEEAKEIINEK